MLRVVLDEIAKAQHGHGAPDSSAPGGATRRRGRQKLQRRRRSQLLLVFVAQLQFRGRPQFQRFVSFQRRSQSQLRLKRWFEQEFRGCKQPDQRFTEKCKQEFHFQQRQKLWVRLELE